MATARAVVRATLLLCALAAAAPLAIGTEPQAASAWPACDECQARAKTHPVPRLLSARVAHPRVHHQHARTRSSWLALRHRCAHAVWGRQGITYQIAAVMGKHVARKRAGAKVRPPPSSAGVGAG